MDNRGNLRLHFPGRAVEKSLNRGSIDADSIKQDAVNIAFALFGWVDQVKAKREIELLYLDIGGEG